MIFQIICIIYIALISAVLLDFYQTCAENSGLQKVLIVKYEIR